MTFAAFKVFVNDSALVVTAMFSFVCSFEVCDIPVEEQGVRRRILVLLHSLRLAIPNNDVDAPPLDRTRHRSCYSG